MLPSAAVSSVSRGLKRKKVYQSSSRSRKNHGARNNLTQGYIFHPLALEIKWKKKCTSVKAGKRKELEGDCRTKRREDDGGFYLVEHMVNLRKYTVSPFTHQSGGEFIIWCRRLQIGEPCVWNQGSWESWESHDHLKGSGIQMWGSRITGRFAGWTCTRLLKWRRSDVFSCTDGKLCDCRTLGEAELGWTCATFQSLSGQTETRWARGRLGLQASEVVITGEGVGVAKQVKRRKEVFMHPPGNEGKKKK